MVTELDVMWIGLADVVPQDDQAPITGAGAFVNVVGIAVDQASFEGAVAQALDAAHLMLLTLEDVELLDERLARHSVDAEILEAADSAQKTLGIQLTTFYSYPSLDD
jgi:hypothetical protein